MKQQVKMVRHQAVMIEPETDTLAVAGKQAEEAVAVGVIPKERLAVMAAIEDMIAGSFGPLAFAGEAGRRKDSYVGVPPLLFPTGEMVAFENDWGKGLDKFQRKSLKLK